MKNKTLRLAALLAAVLASPAAFSQAQLTTNKYPGKVWALPATMETTQWGWFDNSQAPVLKVDSEIGRAHV